MVFLLRFGSGAAINSSAPPFVGGVETVLVSYRGMCFKAQVCASRHKRPIGIESQSDVAEAGADRRAETCAESAVALAEDGVGIGGEGLEVEDSLHDSSIPVGG